MGCPIVNTLVAHNSVATVSPPLLRQWWNSAPSGDGRELPPYPRHYPGPWLGPLSFIVRHTPVGPPCTVGPVGTSTTVARGGATNNMSQFRWFHLRPRRTLLRRPAGFSVTVDDPHGRSHHPRARRLLRINSAAELPLTAPCSLLSLIRLSFRPRARRAIRRRTDLVAGFPPCDRPRVRHSGDQRFGSVAATDSGSISFVSYPPLQVRHNSWTLLRRPAGFSVTVDDRGRFAQPSDRPHAGRSDVR